ncbi:MAG: PDZ domain-containing protein [Acidimicrobiia bacterium]|nr:PDZ domain-containing protein [Acidimicrobiia bacterium]
MDRTSVDPAAGSAAGADPDAPGGEAPGGDRTDGVAPALPGGGSGPATIRVRRVWPWVLVGIMLLVGVAVAISWPIKVPYYALSPGPVEDTSDFVTVAQPVGDPSQGELLFLTVSVRETNLLGYLGAVISDEVDLAPRENIRPAGVSSEQLRQQNLDLMESSKDYAIYVALDRLGHDPQLVGTGALIAQVVEGSAADGALELGDVVVAVDGQSVQFNSDATALVAGHAPGDTIELTVERGVTGDEVETLTVPITLTPFRFVQEDGSVEEDPDRGMVGILLVNDEVTVDFPIPVSIDSQNIGGPSAGMMFTLEVYDQLLDGDLTAGHRIAGTGTIDIDGNVGGIGAIRQKVYGAIAVGADYVLVPASNYDVAVDAAGDGIEVVRIATIDDALAFFEGLPPAT